MQKTRKRSQKGPADKAIHSREQCEIEISIRDQVLGLRCGDRLLRSYPISSSRFGVGTEYGSFKTPVGRFQIAEKIGHGMPRGTVFRARVPLEPGERLPDT